MVATWVSSPEGVIVWATSRMVDLFTFYVGTCSYISEKWIFTLAAMCLCG
jgi:hypothetical protein